MSGNGAALNGIKLTCEADGDTNTTAVCMSVTLKRDASRTTVCAVSVTFEASFHWLLENVGCYDTLLDAFYVKAKTMSSSRNGVQSSEKPELICTTTRAKIIPIFFCPFFCLFFCLFFFCFFSSAEPNHTDVSF